MGPPFAFFATPAGDRPVRHPLCRLLRPLPCIGAAVASTVTAWERCQPLESRRDRRNHAPSSEKLANRVKKTRREIFHPVTADGKGGEARTGLQRC